MNVRSKQRDLFELAIALGLILLIIWAPQLWQRTLWLIAASFVATAIWLSSDGLKPMGLHTGNFVRSLWVVGVALLAAAAAVFLALQFGTLHIPGNPVSFVESYGPYVIFAFVQQFLLQSFFMSRSLRLLPGANSAAILGASIFAVLHLPNPILTAVTLILGLASSLVFLRYRNLYPLAVAHAILGISISITIPGYLINNMRVGLDYLTYASKPALLSRPRPPIQLTQP